MNSQNPPISDDQADEQPWLSPMPGENARWFNAFQRYLALGPARSVHAAYVQENPSTSVDSHRQWKSASKSWYETSRRFDWGKRAEAYDAWRRKEIFATGNAQDTERIKKLDELAEQMHARLIAEIGSIEVNDRFLAQYLAVMDLLAKHTGGYAARKVELTGKNGGKIEVEETQVNVVFYMPEIEPLEDIDALTTVESDIPSHEV